jgi:nicotinamidase-related amidase
MTDYIKTFLDSCKDIDDLIDNHEKICLWVIDMQHDFIDEPFQDETLFFQGDKLDVKDGALNIINGPNKIVEIRPNIIVNNENIITKIDHKKTEINIFEGRFAVTEGSQCVSDISHYFNKLIGNKNCKIIFSRDIHTDSVQKPNHCSFKIEANSGTIDGIGFPAHCVNGTNGCKLHPTIQKMCEDGGDKSIVIMKGCSSDTDSFGAFPYSCKEGNQQKYTDLRQHNGCNKKCGDTDTPLSFTGGFVLEGEDRFNEYIDDLEVKKTTNTKIADALKLEDSKKVLHLVCGLAGDYCVRDTAINLKFAYPTHTVAVIADAVRYPALIDYVIGMNAENKDKFMQELHFNTFKDTLPDDTSVEKMFLTPADVLLYTYSKEFLGEDGVLFALDKNRQYKFDINNQNTTSITILKNKYTQSFQQDDRPLRVPNNPYWCLLRYMNLLGKQMVYCKDPNVEGKGKKCYSDAKGIENVKDIMGTEKRISGNLALKFDGPTGGKRRRSKRMNKKYRSNKNVHKKIKRKTYKHRKTKKY